MFGRPVEVNYVIILMKLKGVNSAKLNRSYKNRSTL